MEFGIIKIVQPSFVPQAVLILLMTYLINGIGRIHGPDIHQCANISFSSV